MDDFEKLGAFYLGKEYDLQAKARGEAAVLYASKDLTTHAVCVGMTGSGKTGLCIGLLEEAAIDGIPAIVIDPKGDLANLLLTFPELSADEFAPWLSPDLLAAPGADRTAIAAGEADRWSKGLAEWGQDGARIARLKAAADFAIYTPGSDAGLPISVLGTFAAPDTGGDREALGDAIEGTVTGLLSLVGVDADPVQSREHILLSTILSTAWQAGQTLDLAGLIGQVQQPPFAKVGVLDLEAFFPQKDRFSLAMRINNLLAAPGFDLWMQGDPLDVQRLLFTPEGRPRVSVISISHLSDQERMFFVSLLLNAAVTWMRRQPGTSSLRALLYMDEVFGYFPPVAEPPSKKPLLTLLKQARAAGFGIVLATQNPADLDYKGLSNTGTWLIGRLQAERDKQRLLDGLEGAAPGAFDRGTLDTLLSSLSKRIFLLHNVNAGKPETFESRWALSYLRGPLTRDEVKSLMADRKAAAAPVAAPPASASVGATPAAAPVAPPPAPAATDTVAPALPAAIDVYYAPRRGLAPADGQLLYVPMVVGGARVGLTDAKADVDESRDVVAVAPIGDGAVPVDWQAATEAPFTLQELARNGEVGAHFAPVPPAAAQAKSYKTWAGDLEDLLARTQSVSLLRADRLKLTSKPGESEGDFRARISLALREQRDAKAAAIQQRYQPKVATLEERLRRAQAAEQKQKEQSHQASMNAVVQVGASILGSLFGSRRGVSITKVEQSVRGASRAMEQHGDVSRAGETVAAVQAQITQLEQQLRDEVAALDAGTDGTAEPLTTVEVRPRKSDVDVRVCALALVPHWRDAAGTLTPAWR